MLADRSVDAPPPGVALSELTITADWTLPLRVVSGSILFSCVVDAAGTDRR